MFDDKIQDLAIAVLKITASDIYYGVNGAEKDVLDGGCDFWFEVTGYTQSSERFIELSKKTRPSYKKPAKRFLTK